MQEDKITETYADLGVDEDDINCWTTVQASERPSCPV